MKQIDILVPCYNEEAVLPQFYQRTCAVIDALPDYAFTFIFVNDANGQNAIIVYAGASGTLSPADLDLEQETIAAAKVFVTQLEQPIDAALRGLQIARAAGTITVFNPAPATAIRTFFTTGSSFVLG